MEADLMERVGALEGSFQQMKLDQQKGLQGQLSSSPPTTTSPSPSSTSSSSSSSSSSSIPSSPSSSSSSSSSAAAAAAASESCSQKRTPRLAYSSSFKKPDVPSVFQMPLHYPRYTKGDYEAMPEWKLDRLLEEYGLPVMGTLRDKRQYAMGIFLWKQH